MRLFIRLFLFNSALALGFLAYLCLIDIIFVSIMAEKVTFLNKLPLLVILMPFIAVAGSSKILWAILKTFTKISVLSLIFLTMSGLAFLEILWVATHFHTMIGGTV